MNMNMAMNMAMNMRMNVRGTAHLPLRLSDEGHVGELALQFGLEILQLLWVAGKQQREHPVGQSTLDSVIWEAPRGRHVAEVLLESRCVAVVRGGWR